MNSWKFWENWGKKKTSPKTEAELSHHLNQVLDASKKYQAKETTRAEKVLLQLEECLKALLIDLKRIKEEHEERMSEFQFRYKLMIEEEKKAFDFSQTQMLKLENQMILIYDYWYREVEIQRITNQLNHTTLSMEREQLTIALNKLVKKNAGIEKGIKERNLDPERMVMLRKKLGVYEGE